MAGNRLQHAIAATAILLLLTGPLAAGPIQLDDIRVEGSRLERGLEETPAAVGVAGLRDIHEGRQRVQMDEALGRIPGVYFENRYNFAQNLRISSRGFGARAPFGVRGLRINIDGIPETLPDGQSQVDAVNLDAVEHMEVIRGPASVLYGNATGGVIDIRTRDGRDMAHDPVVRAEGGSHGFRKATLETGGEQGNWRHHITANTLRSDGYREHSQVRKRQFSARATQQLEGNREISALLNAVDIPFAEDPGGLTREEVEEDRRQAAGSSKDFNAGQSVTQNRVGLVYDDNEWLPGELTLRGFFTRRDFAQQLPFPGANRPAFRRDFFGGGAEYTDLLETPAGPTRYILGLDLARQEDDRERFNVDTDGSRERVEEEQQNATATGLFLQSDTALSASVDLNLGLRFDRVRFSIDDRMGEGDEDDSGSRTFNERSASIGAGWQFHPDHRLYGNLSTAFETPTFTEFANPDEDRGGFNPDIKPQQSLNRELGLRGRLGERLRYDAAVFSVRVKDELMPFQLDPDGRRFYENVARTRRRGMELGLEHATTERLTLTAAWTVADYRFVDFSDRDGNEFDGNRLPGLPRHHAFLEAAWRQPGGLYAALEARFTDRRFAENANEEEVSGHTLVNVRLGRTWRMTQGRRLELFARVENVLDDEHFANIRINASADRFFEPAPPRTAYAGFELGF